MLIFTAKKKPQNILFLANKNRCQKLLEIFLIVETEIQQKRKILYIKYKSTSCNVQSDLTIGPFGSISKRAAKNISWVAYIDMFNVSRIIFALIIFELVI